MAKHVGATGTLALLCSVWVTDLTNAKEPQDTGILRPTHQSILETEEVQVIAREGEVWLDGKALAGRQTAPTRRALSVQIPAGIHQLTWKGAQAIQEIKFAVTTPQNRMAPSAWKVYRAHPPQAECGTCHAAQIGDFKKPTVAETCFTCHERNAFAEGHTHNDEILAECVLCHDPHGSTEKFHLKMTREIACKQCHG